MLIDFFMKELNEMGYVCGEFGDQMQAGASAKGGVWDIEKGIVLECGEGDRIVAGRKGWKRMDQEMLMTVYEGLVFKGVEKGVKRKLEKHKGAYWVLDGKWEKSMIPVILQMTH